MLMCRLDIQLPRILSRFFFCTAITRMVIALGARNSLFTHLLTYIPTAYVERMGYRMVHEHEATHHSAVFPAVS
jgi:hypothetical protein